MTRAQWAQGLPDIFTTPDRITEFLTSGQLSDATGLAEETLLDRLTRKPITRKDNPRGALCRPVARFGDIPLWSPAQLAEYHARVELKIKKEQGLPSVSSKEAHERGLYSTVELAEMLGMHDQTLRRAQGDDETYPDAVARRSRDGRPGVPEHVRELAAVVEWARGRGYAIPGKLEYTEGPDTRLAELRSLTGAEARKRGLVDIFTVAKWWDLTVSDLSTRRKRLGGFPEPVGRVFNESSKAWRNVYESGPVLGWGRGNGFEADSGKVKRSLETAGA